MSGDHLVSLAASLAPWGVVSGRLVSGRDDRPVVRLQVSTEIERVVLEAQVWLLPQVRVLLTRAGVPTEQVMAARLLITSAEADDRLFDE